MTRKFQIFALAACCVLAGCGTENRGLETVHQPVVARTDYVFDIAAPSGEFTSDDAARLGGWFDSLSLRYGDRVSVDTHGYGQSARDAVASVAASYGLLIEENAPVTQGDIGQGAVRVIVSRLTASVPNCPDFSRPAMANFTGSTMSNYGCAINSNFAAMVADPQDLISGRTAASAVDARMSTKAIGTFRAAPNTGALGLKPETTKGK